MKVFFAGYPLSSDPAAGPRDSPEAAMVSVSPDSDRQIVSGAGYPTRVGYDRGNLWTVLSFYAKKRHFLDSVESPQAAAEYLLTYEAAAHHPAKGTLKIILPPDTTGGTARQVVMHDALISPPQRSYLGCLTTFTYRVEGPLLEAATDADFYLFARTSDGDLVPSGERTPTANQMFKLDGDDLIFDSAFAADEHFELSGSDVIPTGS